MSDLSGYMNGFRDIAPGQAFAHTAERSVERNGQTSPASTSVTWATTLNFVRHAIESTIKTESMTDLDRRLRLRSRWMITSSSRVYARYARMDPY